jgi:hypothetical protein
MVAVAGTMAGDAPETKRAARGERDGDGGTTPPTTISRAAGPFNRVFDTGLARHERAAAAMTRQNAVQVAARVNRLRGSMDPSLSP